MSDVTLLGIDLAKNVFQLHGVNRYGKAVLKKRLKRADLAEFISNLPPCKIAMEACSGSNYWARKFIEFGHTVQLISPQHVKPFVKGNKTDAHDAEAIVIASQLERTPSVPIKSVEAQDIQMLHRIRQRYVKNRTTLSNQIRGLLAESGIAIKQGVAILLRELPSILEDGENKLTPYGRAMFNELLEELKEINKKLESYTEKLEQVAKQSPVCQRLQTIPGIGVMCATALIADMGDPHTYKKGRHYSANLGLVPRENSSGDSRVLMGITKKGNSYLRSLLIHGGRAVVRTCKNKTDRGSLWVQRIESRRNKNIAAVAVANKNARIAWAIMMNEENYCAERAFA
jgi:transposase